MSLPTLYFHKIDRLIGTKPEANKGERGTLAFRNFRSWKPIMARWVCRKSSPPWAMW